MSRTIGNWRIRARQQNASTVASHVARILASVYDWPIADAESAVKSNRYEIQADLDNGNDAFEIAEILNDNLTHS